MGVSISRDCEVSQINDESLLALYQKDNNLNIYSPKKCLTKIRMKKSLLFLSGAGLIFTVTIGMIREPWRLAGQFHPNRT
jgi:hypothetical protein